MCCNAANGNSISDSTPVERMSRQPRARSAAYSSSAVLPIPRLSSDDHRGALPRADADEKLVHSRAFQRTPPDVWPEFPHDRPPGTA